MRKHRPAERLANMRTDRLENRTEAVRLFCIYTRNASACTLNVLIGERQHLHAARRHSCTPRLLVSYRLECLKGHPLTINLAPRHWLWICSNLTCQCGSFPTPTRANTFTLHFFPEKSLTRHAYTLQRTDLFACTTQPFDVCVFFCVRVCDVCSLYQVTACFQRANPHFLCLPNKKSECA